MLTSNQPLEAASQVLELAALKAIVKCCEIQRQGFRIIDRWAVDNPEPKDLKSWQDILPGF